MKIGGEKNVFESMILAHFENMALGLFTTYTQDLGALFIK